MKKKWTSRYCYWCKQKPKYINHMEIKHPLIILAQEQGKIDALPEFDGW